VPLEDEVGALVDLEREGRTLLPIATVQNHYNMDERGYDQVVNFCSEEDIGFIPGPPIAAGDLSRPRRGFARIARQLGATPGQIALGWLLRRSPVVLPIPGTSSVTHLEQNLAAAAVHLTDAQFKALTSGL
jgi:pyridoxine 4-dehydrogenase